MRRRTKQVIALMLVGAMSLQVAGCGGKKKNKKSEEVLDKYNLTVEQEFNHSIYEAYINNGTMLASFSDYSDNSESNSIGLIKYDFESAESKETTIAAPGGHYSDVEYMYQDGEKIIARVSIGETEDSSGYTYHYETQNYNENLELLDSKVEDTKKVNYEIDEEDGKITESSQDEEEEYETNSIYVNGYQYCEVYSDRRENVLRKKDADGNIVSEITTDGDVNQLYARSDGTIICDVWGENGTELRKVDFDKKTYDEVLLKLGNYSADRLVIVNDDDIIFSSNNYLCRAKISDGKVKKILKFLDNDIDSDEVLGFYAYENGDYAIVTSSGEKTEIDRLVKKDEAESEKTELTLATLYMDYAVKEKVLAFNKAHSDIRIKVVEYVTEDTKDYESVIKKFNSDIATGNVPDMIDLGQDLGAAERYAKKGILEDLTPYFEKDSELSLDDLVESIVKTYTVNGKLYSLPNCYSIQGFTGAPNVVGDDFSWTVDEFVNLIQSLTGDTQLFMFAGRESILQLACTYNLSKYVNWDTGECRFDSDDFIHILEASNKFDTIEKIYEKLDQENNGEVPDEAEFIRSGKSVLKQEFWMEPSSYIETKGCFGDKFTFKGFPCESGSGIKVVADSPMIAISSKSSNKELAWEFIREFYLPTEEDYSVGFPIRKDELDKELEEAKKPQTYTDIDGKEVEIEGPYGLPSNLTEEEAAYVRSVIDSADSTYSTDDEILNIIEEEAESFYSGQKSAKDVADVIQSRVSIYVKENK